jgi:hypothetical protein
VRPAPAAGLGQGRSHEPFRRLSIHPYSAGYRKPPPHQYLVLALSALAAVIVSGTYLWATLPRTNVPPLPSNGGVGRGPQSLEEFATGGVFCILFFGTIYGIGMALYRYFGDAEGYLVVSSTAGQHLPLLLLLAGGSLAGVHGPKVLEGSGRVVDWLMLATGLVLLALSAWGLYRALFVHRKFYKWFYGSRQSRPPEGP